MIKYLFAFLVLSFTLLPTLTAQTIDWVYLPAGTTVGNCASTTNCATGEICFGIRYTPSVSGRVTSYTLGFIADCPGGALPGVAANSCTMTNNTQVINGCSTASSRFLLTASGNNGNFLVTSGEPVILHQICLPLAGGTQITFQEETVTDLTLSIDLAVTNTPFTEFPTFANFTANTANCSGSLPVTWEAFSARAAGKTALLNWETSAEAGHDRFVVEHGTQAGRFTAIGEVREATTEINGHRSYGFIHNNPAEGLNYYRIRQVDADGTYAFSEIETVVFAEAGTTDFVVFPNPTASFLTLRLAAHNAAAEVALLSVTGRLLFHQTVAAGVEQLNLPTEDLPPGVYLVRVNDVARRFIKR